MATQTTPPAQPADDKKKRHRSPNYPSVGLKEAITRTENYMKVNFKAAALPEAAAKAIGFSSAHGSAMSVLAALKKFGLMEDKDGRVVPTQRGIEIVNLPKTDERRLKAIRDAAVRPPLYAELLEQYKATKIPSDEVLEGELTTYKGFSANAAKEFIKGFRETLEFAGLSNGVVLDSDTGVERPKIGDFVQWEQNGVLAMPMAKRLTSFSDDGGFAFVEGSSTVIPTAEVIPAEAPADDGLPPMPPHGKMVETPRAGARGATMRQDVFSLAEGDVILRWPSPLSAKSVEWVKNWLKIAELKISDSVADEKAEP